jgi:hypothetical protein
MDSVMNSANFEQIEQIMTNFDLNLQDHDLFAIIGEVLTHDLRQPFIFSYHNVFSRIRCESRLELMHRVIRSIQSQENDDDDDESDPMEDMYIEQERENFESIIDQYFFFIIITLVVTLLILY